MLLAGDGTNESDQAVLVGEDLHGVRAALTLLFSRSRQIDGPDMRTTSIRLGQGRFHARGQDRDAGYQPSGAVGFQGPSITVASLSPGQRGIVMQRNLSGSTPVQRYWNAVPTGMSIETPVPRTVVSSPVPSRRHICPSPERTCQNSLTVAWTVARFT